VRFAISLGILMGITHGWYVSKSYAATNQYNDTSLQAEVNQFPAYSFLKSKNSRWNFN
tara:strand:+ start:1077 stop:1250 length:174 start_codon:yes stop_codon:yes gene_type:complete